MAKRKTLTLVCMADTHELHREVEMPAGDILLFAGDATMCSRSRAAISDFNDWLAELPYRHILFVPGNHDSFLEGARSKRKLLSNATVLINEGATLAGLRFWGSPITPLSSGAFCTPSRDDRAHAFSAIPQNTDILITHVPPFEILDHTAGDLNGGCPELLMAVLKTRPKLHVFGHVHAGHGVAQVDDTTFVNVSLLGPDGDIARPPRVFRISSDG